MVATIDLFIFHRNILLLYVHDSKHAYVANADILNTYCKSVCVDKPETSIPRGHLLSANVFASV